jgi:hypothetical protein
MVRIWQRAGIATLALGLPAGAQAALEDCAAETDMATRACLLAQMAEEPGQVEGATCTEDVCRVELACEGGDPGKRTCEGSGYAVYMDWNESKADGFDVYVSEPDGAESWYYLCGGTDTAGAPCGRPTRIDGTLADLDLLAFPGGAMLEFSPVRATEPPPAETYRVPPSAGAFNVRSGPGTVNEVLFVVPAGTSGIVLEGECERPAGGSSEWCPIAWEGQSGWISARGIERE